MRTGFLVCALTSLAAIPTEVVAQETPIKILFLGDNGHHKPNDRFRQLQPVLEKRGIELTYTGAVDALNAKTLARYDGLLIYANTTEITPDQEAALLDFVASGKGFIPLHCASYCFLNSEKYIELVGAQFKSHGTGTVRTKIAEPEHPIMKGFKGFESFDETYVHTKHNEKDRTVLEYREDKKGKEPWTWVRTHGKGRVFYTAWGHDERTWGNPGFHDLVERGIRWAVARSGDRGTTTPGIKFRERPEMTKIPKDLKPFEYKEAKIPYYPPKFGAKSAPKQMQLPLDPAESMKHFVHPTDFELKLFVSEPKIKRPICMNWDERGRLWIAESVDYPNNRTENNDRIVICEDTDGDGVADKITVFADKLSVPTSFTFAYGGIVVTQAPHTLFLRSSKGDDKCDERKILFSGWGTGDTHAGPSNLQYGFDGWIYGIVGYSGYSGNVGGERHKFGQGFFRFKLDGKRNEPEALATVSCTKLEFLRSTSNNSWGVGFSEDGLLFGSTANGNPSVFLPIPNRYYEKVRGMSASVLPTIAESNRFYPITDKVRQVDFHGGFTAAAGHALYTARTYPKEYWNRVAFVAEPTGHLVASFVLNKDGTSFRSKNSWNLLASDDEWSAPIMAEVGPDGNVWVIDWYNYIVQHNPTPPGFKNGKGNAYETPLRDKTHGRIYRLVAKNGKESPKLDLRNAKPERLVAALNSDNLFWRKHAQRLLIERGKPDVAPALLKLIEDRTVDEIGINGGAIHAVWTLRELDLKVDLRDFQGIGVNDPTLFARRAMSHPSEAVRRNAALALPSVKGLPPPIKAIDQRMLDQLLEDPSYQVRLAALLALADLPSHGSRQLVIAAQSKEFLGDRNLRDALTMAAAADPQSFLQGKTDAKPNPAYLDIVRTVAAHYAASKDSKIEELLASLPRAHPDYIDAVLDGTLKGLSKYREFKDADKTANALKEVYLKVPAAGKSKVIRLAKLMNVATFDKQVGEITTGLLKTVADEKQKDAARLAAAQQLIDLADDGKLAEKLLDLITPRSTPQFSVGILEAVGSLDSAGPLLLKRINAFTPQARQTALRILLSRPSTTKQFLDAVDNGTMTFSELALDQKQALASHPDKSIAERAKALLAKGGGLPNADRQKVVEEHLPLLKKTGDVAAGKAVFKKHCAICHTHSGEGAKIGPDLSGVAAHTKEHLLIDILDPSRSVEGNYRVYSVETRKGKTYNGLLASETKTTIELIDTEAKKHVVERDDIESLVASSKSLMPDGFEKTVKQEELIDLLEFLTARGKFVPIALDKAATIVSTRGMFYSKDATVERLILPDWSPRTVKGVPFHFVDPQGEKTPNVIMLYGPIGDVSKTMPKTAKLDCNLPARTIHMLSGVSGWGYPYSKENAVVLIVRLHYADGKTEDHALQNGVHFADYIRKVEVPKSEYAFAMRQQQMRYLSVSPGREAALTAIEFVKGPDASAPIVLAVTVETR
jgi:putative membrane-bound dehydrogenase-like protein